MAGMCPGDEPSGEGTSSDDRATATDDQSTTSAPGDSLPGDDRSWTTATVTDPAVTDGLGDRIDSNAVRERVQARGKTLSRAEADRMVERARRVGTLMDDAFEIPGLGYRIGLDPLIGIAPVSGDAVAAAASLYIVLEGFRLGVPLQTLTSMVLLVGLDFVVGSIPVVGTVIDAVLKVNKRNAATLESYVDSSFDPHAAD